MKKIIALLLVVVLSVTAAVSVTVAYLQDTESQMNTMTVGSVEIEQHEYERALNDDGTYKTYTVTSRDDQPTGYELTEFEQDKPLYPAVLSGNDITFDDTKVYFDQLNDGSTKGYQAPLAGLENVQDKFVFVKNTGKSDAYVRTLIAFEVGSDMDAFGTLIMINYNQYWTANDVGVVSINDNNYYVVEYLYGNNSKHPGGAVKPGEFTYNSLAQVYMKSIATNEDVAAIDGNDNGTYDILVLSQAVQTAGFENAQTALDTAFGDANAANAAEWFKEVTADNGDEDTPGEETTPADPNATGTITPGYTRADAIWGEGSGSANRSFVVKVYSGDTYMGSTSLNNINGIIDGDVYVTWNITLDGESTDYWTMNWAIAPSKDVQPTKVELWVDGTKVAESAVQLNGPDGLNKIGGAVTDSTGKILRYVVGNVAPELGVGEKYYPFS